MLYSCIKALFSLVVQLVLTQELVRISARGYGDGALGGMVIGLPPLMNFGSDELKAKVVPDILAGKKVCPHLSTYRAYVLTLNESSSASPSPKPSPAPTSPTSAARPSSPKTASTGS